MGKESTRGVQDISVVNVGDIAPDFELPALIGGVRTRFRLSEHRGKNVLLSFYPFNWIAASARQMADYQAYRARILAAKAETVAINVESIMNTTAWEREYGPFDFPLCSDFWPHGEVSTKYGVLRTTSPSAGASESAIFVVDRKGCVISQNIYSEKRVPAIEEFFPLLERA
jgi:peroxiredoxin